MTSERPIGFWLRLVDRLIDERFASILEEHGVTRRQWQLLGVLRRSPASAAELDEAVAPFLTEEGETSSDSLGELVESGWVAREGEARFVLTELGQDAFGRLADVVDATRELVAEGVAEEDYATTLATLERMARNFGWSDSAA